MKGRNETKFMVISSVNFNFIFQKLAFTLSECMSCENVYVYISSSVRAIKRSFKDDKLNSFMLHREKYVYLQYAVVRRVAKARKNKKNIFLVN